MKGYNGHVRPPDTTKHEDIGLPMRHPMLTPIIIDAYNGYFPKNKKGMTDNKCVFVKPIILITIS